MSKQNNEMSNAIIQDNLYNVIPKIKTQNDIIKYKFKRYLDKGAIVDDKCLKIACGSNSFVLKYILDYKIIPKKTTFLCII